MKNFSGQSVLTTSSLWTSTPRICAGVSPWSLITLLPCLLGACSVINLEDHRDTNTQKVQQAVNQVRADLEASLQHQVPSLNVLIQTPTEKIFASSVPPGNAPVTETTYFRFASNTKNFTSTAILNMYEDDWLDFRAPITGLIPGTTVPYVPDTPNWNFPYKNSITIEQLLQHSAGVFDVDNDPVPGFGGLSFTESTQTADPTHQFSTDEMVDQLIRHNLSYFAPGTGYHYSNTGYSILAKIIERVYSVKSGSTKTYGDYLKDYVIGSTAPVPVTIHFPVRADDTVLPSPHMAGLVLSPGSARQYGDYNMSAQVGEGNGYGTMAALNTYIRSLMKGQNVLKPETVQIMQTDVSSANPTYALGTTFTKNVGYGHNGARIGNLALIAYDPLTDVSVVVYLPLWDLTQGDTSFLKCFTALYDAAYAARTTLGYPGRP
ncbi:beta-lactamase family protein [Spirosoma taeanense]|uniref:Beta-lactamase family protein n=1 Tax=Spirosoma taeanense TaxID=2735870 RepID=A0A6M5Y879_9BACT|nr:serine hydrolase domain-containing protein [Spirosoma taeanense]QJW89471.1 beta-lactamase family protein [Spirosoma taeanense]